MSDEPIHHPFEWADQLFAGNYDVAPKYRDMLAMLAATMMGNPSAAQHFYNRALVDGASDEELNRAAQIAKLPQIEIGNLTENVQRVVDEMRAEQEASANAEEQQSPPSPN